jgi:hypothetical protein
MRKTKFVCLILVGVIVLGILDIQIASACTPPLEMPWFVGTWQARPGTLPSEISVENLSHNQREYVRITNNSSETIYIVPGDSYIPRRYPTSTVLSGFPYSFRVIEPHNLKEFSSFDAYTPGLKNHSIIYQGERPSNVAIPSPQESWFTLLYQNKRYDVPVRVTYQLSVDYKYYPPPDCYGGIKFTVHFFYASICLVFVLSAVAFFGLARVLTRNPDSLTKSS